MKRFISILLIISACLALISCSRAVSNTGTDTTVNGHVVYNTASKARKNYTAGDYVNGFINASLPVDNVIVYDEETDLNELLGRPNQYTSKVNFADTRIPQSDPEDPIGGTVEVFNNNDDLQLRKSDLESVEDLYQFIYVSPDGLALLRISYVLNPEDAEEYVNVLNNIEDYIDLTSPPKSSPAVPANTAITIENEFNFSADDVFSTMKTDNELATFTTRHTFEYDQYIADWASIGSIRAVCFVSKTSNKVMAIILACQNLSVNTGHGDVWIEHVKQVLGLCGSDKTWDTLYSELSLNNFIKGATTSTASNSISIRFSWDNDFACFRIAPESTALDIASLPIRIDKPEDFLKDDKRRDGFEKMLESYDFKGIIEAANAYIGASNPQPEDYAYKAIELSQKAKEQLSKCKINKDSHTDDITIYYKGVEAISKSINIVPYMGDYGMEIRLGFKASNWVYFEETSIKVGEDEFIEDSYSNKYLVRDVISGGVLEYIDTTFYHEDIEKIINADSPTIRFIGEGDKKRDHAFTASEIKALKLLDELAGTLDDLSYMIYEWEEL